MGRRTGNLSRSSSTHVGFVERASLASDLGIWSNFIITHRTGPPSLSLSTPFAAQTLVNNVYCLFPSESNSSFPIQSFPLLYLPNYFCRYLSPPPISTTVIPGHTHPPRRSKPLLGPTPILRPRVHARGCVSQSRFRRQAYARTSVVDIAAVVVVVVSSRRS